MPVLLKGKSRKPASPPEDPEEFRATLIEHLEELRDRIMRSLIMLTVGWVAGWYLEPWVYNAINGVVNSAVKKRLPPTTPFQTVFHQATEPFLLMLKLSFMIGVIIAFPFIVLQLWGFVSPGLKSMERRIVKGVAPMSVLLFAMGAFFCWMVLPSAFTWFTSYLDNYQNTALFQEAGTMVFFVLKMELAFGVGFQLPLVVYIVGKLGLLSPETLLKHWRQATVAIFVISAIVTPSNDPLTMLMMAVPLSLLFIASVYVLKATSKKDGPRNRKRRKRGNADGDTEELE